MLQTLNGMSTRASVRSQFNSAGLDEGKRPDNRELLILEVGVGVSQCAPP